MKLSLENKFEDIMKAFERTSYIVWNDITYFENAIDYTTSKLTVKPEYERKLKPFKKIYFEFKSTTIISKDEMSYDSFYLKIFKHFLEWLRTLKETNSFELYENLIEYLLTNKEIDIENPKMPSRLKKTSDYYMLKLIFEFYVVNDGKLVYTE